MGEHFESGEQKTLINTFILGGKMAVSEKLTLDVKVPYVVVTGDLANTSGVGDISISASRRLKSAPGFNLVMTLGTRLKTNDSDKTEDGRPLPMAFQTSLGTNDILAGLTATWIDWHFSLGYQHPFTRNNNGFLRNTWPDNPEAQEYFESSHFKRGDDVALRVEKKFRKDRFDIFVGVLGLYRIEKDEIIREGVREKLANSAAPTININGSIIYRLSPKINLRATYGNPIVWRKSRADGLERVFSFTSGLEIRL